MSTTRKPIRSKVSRANQIRHKCQKTQRKNIPKKRTVKPRVRSTLARGRMAKLNVKKICSKTAMCSECCKVLNDFSVAVHSLKQKGRARLTEAQLFIGFTSIES